MDEVPRFRRFMKLLRKVPFYYPIRDIIFLYTEKRVTRAAAQLSYFLTLSIFPLLIILSYILGTFDFQLEGIVELLEGIVPSGTIQIILDFFKHINENDSTAMLAGGIILFVTSSSAAFRSIMVIMNEVQGKQRFTLVGGTLVSFLFSLLFVIVIYLSVGIILSGGWFLSKLNEYFYIGIFADIWQWLRFFVLFLLLFGMIYGLYRSALPKRNPRPQRILGAFLASIFLVIVSAIFSWFISISTRYSLVYGSLASIIILMVWLYYCGNILMIGNVINVVINRHRRKKRQNKLNQEKI